jgi:hypothetical protein
MEGSDEHARLWEISENLHRAELSVLERSLQIAEWTKLTAGAQVGPKPKSVRAVAREISVTRQEVARAQKIATISPEAREAVVEAGLDNNQSALIAIAEAPEAVAQVMTRANGAKPETRKQERARWLAELAARKANEKAERAARKASVETTDEGRTRSFLARARTAIEAAKLDDLAWLEFTAEMNAAKEGVTGAWGELGHAQWLKAYKAERAVEKAAEADAIASIIAEGADAGRYRHHREGDCRGSRGGPRRRLSAG